MPLYMDRHDFAAGVTAIDIAGAHLKDLEVQGCFGVRFLNYWFDVERQTAFGTEPVVVPLRGANRSPRQEAAAKPRSAEG